MSGSQLSISKIQYKLLSNDNVVLMIETNIFNSECRVEQKFNYNKGDYDALRTYIECDWNTEFAAVNLELRSRRDVEYHKK